jgi:hypothetical protein
MGLGADSTNRMRIEHERRLGVFENLNSELPTDRRQVPQKDV